MDRLWTSAAQERGASVPRSCGRCRGCHSPSFSFGFCGRGNLGLAFGSPVFCSARFVPPEQPRGPPLFQPSLDVQRDGRHHTSSPPGSFLNADGAPKQFQAASRLEAVIFPLPSQALHLTGYILWPGFTGCNTAGKPVPLHAGQLSSLIFGVMLSLSGTPQLAASIGKVGARDGVLITDDYRGTVR
jgi:hypothetical protein